MSRIKERSYLAKNALGSTHVSRTLIAIALINLLLVLVSSGSGAQDLTPISGGSQVRRVLVADDVSLSDPSKRVTPEQNISNQIKAGQHSAAHKHVELVNLKANNSTIAAITSQGSQVSPVPSNESISRQTRATTRRHTTPSTTPVTTDTETSTTTVKTPSSKLPVEDLDDGELEKIVEERKKKKKKPESEDDTDDEEEEEDDLEEHAKRRKSKNKHRTTSTTTSTLVDTSTATQTTPESMKQSTDATDASARAILPTLKVPRRRRPTGAPKMDTNSTTSLSQINKSLSSPKPLNVSTEYLKTTTPWSSNRDLSKYLNNQRRVPNQSKSSSSFQYVTVATNPIINDNSSTTPSLVSDTNGRFQYLPNTASGTYQSNTFNGSTTPIYNGSTSGGLQELVNQSDKSGTTYTINSSTTPYFVGESSTRPQNTVETGNGTFSINIANGSTTPSSIGATSGRLQDIFEQGNRTIAELIKDIKELHVRIEEGPKDQADSLRRFIIFCSIVAKSNANLTMNQSVLTSSPQDKQSNMSSDYLKTTSSWFLNPDISKYPSSKRNEPNFTSSSYINVTDQTASVGNVSLSSFRTDSTTPPPINTSSRIQDAADPVNRANPSSTNSPNAPPTITKTVAHPQETVEPSNRTMAILIKDLKEEHTKIEEGTKEQANSLRHFIIICSIAVVIATSLAVALILLLMR